MCSYYLYSTKSIIEGLYGPALFRGDDKMSQIVRLDKGAVTTTHPVGTNLTATSSAIHIGLDNSVLLKTIFTGTGSWTFKILGALTSNGTFVDWYDNNGNLMSTGSISTNRGQVFVGLPQFIKVVATKDSGTATVEVKIQPITV